MKPKLKLVGEDGNVFAILGRARKAARLAGWTDDQWTEFHKEATSFDYDHVLQACMEHFDCDEEDEDEQERT